MSILLEEPDNHSGIYRRLKTYLCEPISGKARPGSEPEPEAANHYSIIEVKWFNLRSEVDWDNLLVKDSLTYLPLQAIRQKLGYLTLI